MPKQITSKKELIKFIQNGFELLQAKFTNEVAKETYEYIISSDIIKSDKDYIISGLRLMDQIDTPSEQDAFDMMINNYKETLKPRCLTFIAILSDKFDSLKEQALGYYTKGAKAGSGVCAYILAEKYETGTDVTQDYDKALEYYKLALKNGVVEAENDISRIESLIETDINDLIDSISDALDDAGLTNNFKK